MIPLETQEEAFLWCIVNSMDKSQQLFVENSLNIRSSNNNELVRLLFTSLRNHSDCVKDKGNAHGHNFVTNKLSCIDFVRNY